MTTTRITPKSSSPRGISTINHRVTFSESPLYARSESSIAINPRNPYNIVAASKKFSNPDKYEFSLAVYYTLDGGETWKESAPLQLLDGWAGVSDPALAWDISQSGSRSKTDIATPNANELKVCTTTINVVQDTVHLVALPFSPDDGPIIGIAVYESNDGGITWSPPKLIHNSVDPAHGREDDKQWAIGDYNPLSPFFGNVYAVWDDGPGVGFSYMAFARSVDHGQTWIGLKDQPAGSDIPGIMDSGAPEISVAADGTIYIVWLGNNNRDVKFVKSTDGGDSFTAPIVAASGIIPLLYPYIESTHGWSHFPGATFRMGTYCTGCTTAAGNIIVFAWADYREGISRIYYRRSVDGGITWEGPSSGQPLLVNYDMLSENDQQDFHPQLIATPSGEIGCAFYEFGPKGRSGIPPVWENSLIDVIMAISLDDGKTFSNRIVVTEHPWDPTVGAPFSHGDPDVTFLGEYFGLDASILGFFPLWTDTRTGMQEIFTARVNEIHANLEGRNPSVIPYLNED
jgi:BNR/Asp-box repeat protein